MVRNYKILLYLMFFVWFLVNLIQASYTEILSDEAYYGLYSRHLAWGYFDHPPMVALMVKISSLFFNGNLGVRFMTVLTGVFTLLFIWKCIDDEHPDIEKIYSFFIIAGSICLFAAYGFFTTPDVPLLFFTAFFLFSYKKFISCQTWKNTLLLSLSMAGLVYSKYHAVLVIGFVILSNIRLLRSYKFWIAGVCASLLFTPHLMWQAANGYPSFRFQLIERSEGLKWANILEYIPNQLAVFNPFVLGAVFYILIKNKPKDLFTRALYFLITGFICFFGLAAFHDHVEPQWTASCSVSIIILLYNNSTVNPKMFRFIRTVLLPTLLLLFIIRILLVLNLPIGRKLGFSGKRAKFEFIESVAKDLPVLFPGSFQGPSLYTFFTGREGIGINVLSSRKTEFDIWQLEKKYNNRPAFICGFAGGHSQLFEKEGMKFYGFATDSLQTISRIGVEIRPRLEVISAGDTLRLTLIFKNNYPYDIDFNHPKFPVTICAAFIDRKCVKLFPADLQDPVGIMKSGESLERGVTILVPELSAGRYNFGICLQTYLGPAINDSFFKIKIAGR
jgi:hypothetical protein